MIVLKPVTVERMLIDNKLTRSFIPFSWTFMNCGLVLSF